jgi:hypothetical protein
MGLRGVVLRRAGNGFDFYKRFFAKALPEAVLRYCSNWRAFSRSIKAIAVFKRHGLNLLVCAHCPLLWALSRLARFYVKPE